MKCSHCGVDLSVDVIRIHEAHCGRVEEDEVVADTDSAEDTNEFDVESLTEADLETFSVKKLKAVLTHHEIAFGARDTKDELIALVEGFIYG